MGDFLVLFFKCFFFSRLGYNGLVEPLHAGELTLGHRRLRTGAAGTVIRARAPEGPAIRGGVAGRGRTHRHGPGVADAGGGGEVVRGNTRRRLRHVGEVDERLRAPVQVPRVLRRRGPTLGDHPEPGVVVDDLHVLVLVKLLADLRGVPAALVPRAEVDEDAPVLIALLVRLGHHVHALNKAELQRVEDRADPLLRDVLEDPRDTDAVDDGLRLALRATLLLLRLGGGTVRCRHFEVES